MYEEILSGLYMVGSGNLTHGGDCQVFLVQTSKERGVLIDAGADPTAKGITQNLDFLNIKPTHIILTHGHIDHIGGANALKEHFGAELLAHGRDVDVMERYDPIRSAAGYYGIRYPPVEVDMVISEEIALKIDKKEFRILEMPGHTPGSIAAFCIIRQQKVLFGQDIHGPFNPVWGSDRVQHTMSMKKLLGLKADILCEGHFGVIKPAERVRKYIEGYL